MRTKNSTRTPRWQEPPRILSMSLSVYVRIYFPRLAPRGPCVWCLYHHVPSPKHVHGTWERLSFLLFRGTGESPGEKKALPLQSLSSHITGGIFERLRFFRAFREEGGTLQEERAQRLGSAQPEHLPQEAGSFWSQGPHLNSVLRGSSFSGPQLPWL